MRLSSLLSGSRTVVVPEGGPRLDKAGALRRLAELLVEELPVGAEHLAELLERREQLQSTGIGDGVAIPHTSLDEAPRQLAALLLCPAGVPFDSVDGRPARILVGVVGPRRMAGEHLKALARISRLLRDPQIRDQLLGCQSAEDAFRFIQAQDQVLG